MTGFDLTYRTQSRLLTIARQELVILWRDKSLPTFLLLLSVLLVGGLSDGLHRISAMDTKLARAAEHDRPLGRIAEQLSLAEASGAVTPLASPVVAALNSASQYAMMPTLPLAPLALGQSDLLANPLIPDGMSEAQFLYDSDIGNPWRLATGHFDVAFVVVFLLPLLIFSLSYNLLSGERELGTLRLLLTQSASPTMVALGKTATRAIIIATPLLALPLPTMLLFRPIPNLSEFFTAGALWVALTLAYCLFWLSLSVLINSFCRSSAFNALALVGSWVVLTLVVPAALNLAVDALYPSPSRAQMIGMLTELSEQAARRNADLDRTDYGAMSDPGTKDGKFVIPSMAIRSANMQKEVSEAMRPWVERFEIRSAERRSFVGASRILSPAATVFEGLNVLSGTDADRHSLLRSSAARFYREETERALPRLSTGTPTTAAELRSLPRFVWAEDRFAPSCHAAGSLAQILAPTALVIMAALFRLRSMSV
ncbi:ABC transporter permease subunit [Methylocystis bryophila]|uniref:ABC transporter permease n=1 Tax=Methylocystis bryophila TaxID=655015 RepID=A0A1W6N298_9HYPH|nr:ABC transporter permease subunit [Methylocystis bryophila]ARN83896.1 hypothetical protein B1812_21695 [Methylocystis bryophila]BDV40987.1 hypothetical protein DSM21852_42410 [Methylocystis bryophila]